jgi:hypothetical protein
VARLQVDQAFVAGREERLVVPRVDGRAVQALLGAIPATLDGGGHARALVESGDEPFTLGSPPTERDATGRAVSYWMGFLMTRFHWLGLLVAGLALGCSGDADTGSTTSTTGSGAGTTTGPGGMGTGGMATGGMGTGGMATGGMGAGGMATGGMGAGGMGAGGMGAGGMSAGGMSAGGMGAGGMGAGGMGGGMTNPLCMITPQDNACTTCAKTNCCNEMVACAGDVQCSCIIQCVVNGGAGLTCFSMCGGQLVGATADLLNCQNASACGCI